ncbi:MAG: hypothetical protein RIT27_2373 [Pseudomonadota bacterium]
MKEIKLVFTGSMGAGKTTAISALSEIPVINTDVNATDEVIARKATTTVALDYGEMTLPDGQKLRLYGTPGQERFAYMWKILMQGALGLIILVDNAGENPLGDLDLYLKHFREDIEKTTAVIGITRMDLANKPNLAAYNDFLRNKNLQLPVFSVDVRRKHNVVMMVQALVAMLEY